MLQPQTLQAHLCMFTENVCFMHPQLLPYFLCFLSTCLFLDDGLARLGFWGLRVKSQVLLQRTGSFTTAFVPLLFSLMRSPPPRPRVVELAPGCPFPTRASSVGANLPLSTMCSSSAAVYLEHKHIVRLESRGSLQQRRPQQHRCWVVENQPNTRCWHTLRRR